jgi:hypothetical protein
MNRELSLLRTSLLSGAMLALFGAAQATDGNYLVNPQDADGRALPGFYPNVELDFGYDDNVRRTEKNTDSSTFTKLKPEVQWVGVFGKHLVRFGYQGDYAKFFDEPRENYYDHFVGADVTLDLTPKFTLNGGAAYRHEHEDRGSAAGGNGRGPNTWEQWSGKIEGLYGRRIATMQIGAGYERHDREYTNNNQGFRDNVADILTLVAYYNLGPRTRLLIEPSVTQYDYSNSNSDNTYRKILAGVAWDATAKTTGEVKLGYYDKDFDSGSLEDSDGFSIDASVQWRPKTYSIWEFRVSQDAYDSDIAGSSASAYEQTTFAADWEHDLTSFTQLQAGASYEVDDYDDGREDDYLSAYLGLSYALTRSITVGARYDFSQRDSSEPNNDFDDNVFTIGFKTTLD